MCIIRMSYIHIHIHDTHIHIHDTCPLHTSSVGNPWKTGAGAVSYVAGMLMISGFEPWKLPGIISVNLSRTAPGLGSSGSRRRRR
jgi:hypothetical protein